MGDPLPNEKKSVDFADKSYGGLNVSHKPEVDQEDANGETVNITYTY